MRAKLVKLRSTLNVDRKYLSQIQFDLHSCLPKSEVTLCSTIVIVPHCVHSLNPRFNDESGHGVELF